MKKIMFNDRYGLTQAVLDGKKTMTRRIVTIDLYNQTDWKAVAEGDLEAVVDGEGYYHDIRNCGKYHVGEEVAIAQSYEAIGLTFISPPDTQWGCTYEMQGYSNKMFVRADLMPHRIRITNIKVERLQDISDEDCIKEGVEKWIDCYIVPGIMENQGKNNVCFDTPREAFAALIDRISGRGTWQSNPWVYAYTFELKK
jgi:hypothetical protein